MNRLALVVVLVTMAFAAPSIAHAYKCGYLPAEPASVWISSVSFEEKSYVGVGSAEKADSSTEQMDKSFNRDFAAHPRGGKGIR